MDNKIRQSPIRFLFFVLSMSLSTLAWAGFGSDVQLPKLTAPEAGGSVEINGDTVEYSTEGSRVLAKGNVVINYQGTMMYCDEVDFSRETKVAHAKGRVRLVKENTEITGEDLTYNFATATGDFNGARLAASPFFGGGRTVSKVTDNKIVVNEGMITTCDFDKPHFHLGFKKMEMTPGVKMVARGNKLFLGDVPVMLLPNLSQKLTDRHPIVIFTPGYDKQWGAFLLSKWRYYLNDYMTGTIHLDYRERLDLAEGADLKYNTKGYGNGLLRLYYTNQRKLGSKHQFQKSTNPTVESERFRVEWRHKWQIDKTTDAILQYYRASDATVTKDFFKKEYDKDFSPNTYFLLTKGFSASTLSFRTDARVNRFNSEVQRLPEIAYNFSSQQLGQSGFYLQSDNTYSNLSFKNASPSELRRETMRVDTNNELSYPFKISFLELKPFVGGRETYYSKTNDANYYDVVRGLFMTGTSLSTKFYRTFDVAFDKYGIEINRLRHIITPSIAYLYTHKPTIASSRLDQYDSIDNLTGGDSVNLSIENKLQTKRNGVSVDLARMIVGTDYRFKGDPAGGGFDQIKSEADITPMDWLSFYFDSDYDTRRDKLSTANFDVYINGKDKWRFGIGKRFDVDVDDQLTTDFMWKLNPMWILSYYQRFDVNSGTLKEQDYTLTRDLHEWTANLNFNQTRGQGSEITMVFTLKSFPDIALDFGSRFNRRKLDSQSSP